MNKPIERAERPDIERILALGRSIGPQWLERPWAKWALAALAVLLIVLAATWLRGSRTTVRYVTEPAARGNLLVAVTATGSVQPTNKVDVSSELSGTVRKVLVDFNSPVKAGDTLAELDTDKLNVAMASARARVAATKAKVAEAQATLVEKQRDLARKRLLVDRQVSSGLDLDTAEAAYERAKASLASTQADVGVAEADLKLAETNLAKACICSPINGVVLKRSVDPGQTVASSFQAPVLFSIAEDLTQMELQVDVDEADVGKVKPGQKATFTVDAFPDRRFPARIRDIRYASETVQGVVAYKAVLTIDNAELLLRPGMTATAEIAVTEVNDALLVPNAALRYAPPTAQAGDTRSFLQRLLPGRPPFRAAAKREETGDQRTVWVLRNGAPVAAKVKIGASDGRKTEIREGELAVGEAVITSSIEPRS